jgi:glycosyltransferase involved in cell wall biosynthesis
MVSIAIMAPDVLATSTSGYGLRSLGLGRSLAAEHDVKILARGDSALEVGRAQILTDPNGQTQALRTADVVISAASIPSRRLVQIRGAIVSDLYDPWIIETLTIDRLTPESEGVMVRDHIRDLVFALRFSRHILCANVQQRDLYLGMLLGSEFLGHRELLRERELLERILVLPNGIEASPLPDRLMARRRLGFAPEEIVLLWGGGVWDWLDPVTVVSAIAEAAKRAPMLRLVFLGLQREGYRDPNTRHASEFLDRCRVEGLFDTVVRANRSWVDLDERTLYLAASDAGIIGQGSYLESHFSFRTRFVDCLWAGIPVLAAGSDPLTDEGVAEGWAVRCPPGDPGALAKTLVRFAESPTWREDLRRLAHEGRKSRSWEQVSGPLRSVLEHNELPSRRERFSRSARSLGRGAGGRLQELLDSFGARQHSRR